MMLAGISVLALLTAVGHSSPVPNDFHRSCSALAASLDLPDTTIWASQPIRANTNVTFPENDPSCNRPGVQVSVDMCRVTMMVSTGPSSNVSMEAWLPLDWSGRFLSTGNGGLGGCIQYEDMAYGVAQGFAAVSGNGGHNGTSGAPLLNNPGSVEDLSYRSVHLSAVLGKQVSEFFYGRSHTKSYYLGCSTGGRQGFKEAQDFPDDFDGIVAGAPAFDFLDQISWSGSFFAFAGEPGSPNYLSKEQWAMVMKNVLAQCDGLDGVVDGVIEDPNLCHYRAEDLACDYHTQSTDGCLTSDQIDSVKKMFSPLQGEDGEIIYPRFQPGGNPSVMMMTGRPFPYTLDWFRYVVYNDASWDPASLNPQDYSVADAENPFDIRTWKGDLSGARDGGVKILHYHGLQDSVISSDNSQRYYEHVERTMGLDSDKLGDFYRYFRISGMDHCNGGRGAWKIGNNALGSVGSSEPEQNVLQAVVQWVERGEAPEFVMGSGVSNTTGPFQRRHCRFPLSNKYKGSGDAADPDSWECV